jgi:hypothetical protein
MSSAVFSIRPHGKANGQLRALVALRWRMIRSRSHRWALVALLFVPPLIALAGINGLRYAPEEQAFNIALATPTLYLAFAMLAVIAPLAAGGGYELYPSEQLVAYPIHPRTVYRGTLLLAPANLAWILNVVALLVVTAFAAGPLGAGTSRALVSTVAFIALATVCGQTFAWFVVGCRQTRRGRLATWTLAGVIGVSILVVVRLDLGFEVLDRSLTKYSLFNAYDGYTGRYGEWLIGLVLMLVGTALALVIGGRVTAWALRRPGDHAHRDSSRPVRRREPRPAAFAELLAIDRASVWRSLPLRRGILVLLLLPGSVAALAGMSWQSLVLLPGLVAAGAGLLFGINAFALDSSGSTWLSTLPEWPRYAFASKVIVIFEVALLSVTAALIGGSLRAPAPSSAADVTAAVAAAVACACVVVATGMRSSLRHPYRADLRSSRDTPAPPGVMAMHSVRLALVTTLISLLFAATSMSHLWWLPLLLAVPVVSWAGLSLIESQRAWSHPHVRAYVVTTVSGG